MRSIAIFGGNSINVLGPISDILIFFQCIDTYVIKANLKEDYSLLTDRLYKRYLRREEVGKASEEMNLVKNLFSQIPTDQVNFENLGIDLENTRLALSEATLDKVFIKYFNHFEDCKETCTLAQEILGYFQPVRFVIGDLPYFMVDKNRPLADYDNLPDDAEPFWMR